MWNNSLDSCGKIWYLYTCFSCICHSTSLVLLSNCWYLKKTVTSPTGKEGFVWYECTLRAGIIWMLQYISCVCYSISIFLMPIILTNCQRENKYTWYVHTFFIFGLFDKEPSCWRRKYESWNCHEFSQDPKIQYVIVCD